MKAPGIFLLPLAEKEKCTIEHSVCHRGWSRVGGENLDLEKQERTGDLKRSFKIGHDLPPEHERVKAGLARRDAGLLRPAGGAWYKHPQRLFCLDRIRAKLFRALTRSHDDRSAPLRYPPQTGRINEASLGAGTHTDCGCLTLLRQDSSTGYRCKGWTGAGLTPPQFPAPSW